MSSCCSTHFKSSVALSDPPGRQDASPQRLLALAQRLAQHPRTDAGSTMLFTLLLLAFMTMLILGLTSRILLTYRVHHEAQRSASDSAQLWERYAQTLAAAPSQTHRCVQSSARTRRLCLWENPPLIPAELPAVLSPERGFSRASLPLWGLASFQHPTVTCLSRVPTPAELSQNALRSLRSCTPARISGSARIDGNLFPATPLFEGRSQTLVVLGSVRIGRLLVAPPVTIFAAGEIWIDSVEITSGAPTAPLALISATDRITVQRYSGPAVLSAISPIAVKLPSGSEAASLADPSLLTTARIVEGSF